MGGSFCSALCWSISWCVVIFLLGWERWEEHNTLSNLTGIGVCWHFSTQNVCWYANIVLDKLVYWAKNAGIGALGRHVGNILVTSAAKHEAGEALQFWGSLGEFMFCLEPTCGVLWLGSCNKLPSSIVGFGPLLLAKIHRKEKRYKTFL